MTAGPEVVAAARADAAAIAALRTAVARELTSMHGQGHWSSVVSEAGVLAGMAGSRVLVARDHGIIVGTFRLTAKKPWAIDVTYFSPVRKALYLVDMAVAPHRQRSGIGRALLDAARLDVATWSVEAIRLDAYDGPMGAGPFYAKCGFREVGRAVYRTVPLRYFEWLVAAHAAPESRGATKIP